MAAPVRTAPRLWRQLRQEQQGGEASGCEPGFYLPSSGCQQCSDGRLPSSFGDCPVRANARTAGTVTPGVMKPNQRPFLHGLFSDNMVIARGRRGRIFGYAVPGTKVTVTLRRQSTGSQVVRVSTTTNMLGRWTTNLGKLPGLEASGPFTLTATRVNYSVTRRNILIGEVLSVGTSSGASLQLCSACMGALTFDLSLQVWLVAGQSNMVYALADVVSGSGTFKAAAQAELRGATDNNIRTFQVPRNFSETPLTNVAGKWNLTSPSVMERFSMIGYVYAKKLRAKLKVPIGILESDFGGSSIVQWLPPETLRAIGGVPLQEADPTQNLYNAMINNLGRDFGGFDVNGAVWYQGESDGGLTATNPLYSMYQGLLEQLLSSYRTMWATPSMPWIIVQLAAFIPRYAFTRDPFRSNINHWPYVRDAQRLVALKDPNAYLISAVDLGHHHVVHPPNKWDVAFRLSRMACRNLYGFKTDLPAGPSLATAQRNPDSTVSLTFNDVSSRLMIARKDNTTTIAVTRLGGISCSCFQLQDAASGAWRNVTAFIRDEVRIVVSPIKGRLRPSGVRYGWLDGALVCNVYNSAGLPLFPFQQALS